MSETTTKKRGCLSDVLIQAASIFLGWILLSCVNLVPDVMCMPLVRAVRDYDPYARIVDYEFAPALFVNTSPRTGI